MTLLEKMSILCDRLDSMKCRKQTIEDIKELNKMLQNKPKSTIIKDKEVKNG